MRFGPRYGPGFARIQLANTPGNLVRPGPFGILVQCFVQTLDQRTGQSSSRVEETNLTADERRLLPDPTRLTEDDADALSVIRSEMRDEPTLSLDEARAFLFGKSGRRRK